MKDDLIEDSVTDIQSQFISRFSNLSLAFIIPRFSCFVFEMYYEKERDVLIQDFLSYIGTKERKLISFRRRSKFYVKKSYVRNLKLTSGQFLHRVLHKYIDFDINMISFRHEVLTCEYTDLDLH